MAKITWKIFTSLPQEAVFIRTAVFVNEQGFCQEFDDIDARAHHLLIYIDAKAVGTARFFNDDEQDTAKYTIGRLAVLKEYRHLHLGSSLMQAIETAVRQKGGKTLVLSAQCQARRFYENLGYTASGSVYLDESCPHIHMEKYL